MQTMTSEKKNKFFSFFDALRFLSWNMHALTILDILEANIDMPTIAQPMQDEVWRHEDILRIPTG